MAFVLIASPIETKDVFDQNGPKCFAIIDIVSF